jgi:hypothetical protein
MLKRLASSKIIKNCSNFLDTITIVEQSLTPAKPWMLSLYADQPLQIRAFWKMQTDRVVAYL